MFKDNYIDIPAQRPFYANAAVACFSLKTTFVLHNKYKGKYKLYVVFLFYVVNNNS